MPKGDQVEKLNAEVELDTPAPEHVPALLKLNADLKKMAVAISPNEARQLVSVYYAMQDERKRMGLRRVFAEKDGKPMRLVEHFEKQAWFLEQQVKKALDLYTAGHEIGQHLRAIRGIGPVLSAGLMTWFVVKDTYPEKHDLAGQDRIRNVVGAWWSFAGLHEDVVWEKGQKRPYSVEAKTLLYKVGESFVKVQAHKDDVYGKLYKTRKGYEEKKNAAGEYGEQAAIWAKKMPKTSPTQEHYGAGKLPQHHIHARCRRWTVKLFLSHFFEYRYRLEMGAEPPKPYPMSILGHKDYIPSPFPNPLKK